MGMTITEKILTKHSGKRAVSPGDNIWVDVDILMTHDVCGPGTIEIFKKNFGNNARVWDREGTVIIPDHYIFTKDQHAGRNIEILREFAKEQDLPYFYDVGTSRYRGVCHVALAQEGHTRPGEVLFGTDSHTCTAGAFGEFATGIGNTDAALIMGIGKLWVKVPPTVRFVFDGEVPPYIMAKDMILTIIGKIGVEGANYMTMEFAGDGVYSLSIDERMTLCNMVIEAGAKNGVISPDKKTISYVVSHTKKSFEIVENDHDARFRDITYFKSNELVPMAAKPHSPDNTAPARDLKDIRLDRCYIGSCTGGKLDDFKAAAKILKGHNVVIDTYIVPATVEVADAIKNERLVGKTLLDIFTDAGAKIGDPSCAACLGGPVDTFGRLNNDEVCLSTTNRNFPGRMGSKGSQVYLASPYTVAASALTGKITDPRDFLC